MASDNAKTWLSRMTTQDMTESVVYRPRNGKPRTIVAMVDRSGPEGYAGAGADAFVLTVLNDELEGIAVSEIDTGGDAIDVARLRGGDVTERLLHRILQQDDPEFVQVGVR